MLNIIFCFFRDWISHFGRSFIVISQVLISFPKIKWFPSLLVTQIYSQGVLSLVIIVLSAFSVGAVLALQFYTELVKFSATENVGSGLAIVVIRELAPVLTALLFSGRSGSALTAEIGLMKTTQQLTVMDTMAVSPLKYVLFPRLLAGIFVLPILTMIFMMISIFSGYIVAVPWLGVDDGLFWSNMQESVSLNHDLLNGLLKSLVFGVLVTAVSVFHGYDSVPTPSGVSAATTRTVVYSAIIILSVDFLLTLLMFGEF